MNMKRMLPFLMALCLLFATTAAQAASGHSTEWDFAAPEGEQSETIAQPDTELESESVSTQPVTLPMTAQQWIRSFLGAASTQGLTLEDDFTYEPGMHTGQHSYSITIAEMPAYVIGMSVFSDDGVDITICSIRLTSAMLHSSELVQAGDTLWRAARAMIAASDPEAAQEDIGVLCEALCADLPAALIRGEEVDVSQVRQGLNYSLWAGLVADAFVISADGYIVDFMVQADMPQEPG